MFSNTFTVKITHGAGIAAILVLVIALGALIGCGSKTETEVVVERSAAAGVRDSKPIVLVPQKGGEEVIGSTECSIDLTNKAEGYMFVTYTGDNDDVKLRLTMADSNEYTYSLPKGDTIIPFSEGSGEYKIVVYEGIGDGAYATSFDERVEVSLSNEFGPFLYPNQYVWFTDNTKAVSLASQLASGKSCDLEVLASVYDYVVSNISYDYEEAETVQKGYLPDVDEVLDTKKGICFDYAALMTAMLRSQGIPSKLVIGYAGDEYHAWINAYVPDVGWIDEIIKFDGTNWSLMDPTFASNSSVSQMKKIRKKDDFYVTRFER